MYDVVYKKRMFAHVFTNAVDKVILFPLFLVKTALC